MSISRLFTLGTILCMAAETSSAGNTPKASSKSASKEETKKSKAPTGEGWNDETEADIEGWFKPEEGATIMGKLVGYIQIADKKKKEARDVAIIELAEDCEFCVVDKKKTTLKKGQCVGVGLRAKISGVVLYKFGSGIYIEATEKIDIGGGQTMWKFEWKGKGEKHEKKPAPQRTNLKESEVASAGEEVAEGEDFFQ